MKVAVFDYRMKNFLYILGGTVLTQMLVFFLSPILSRLYSPQDFGEFALLVTFSYIFASFFSLRLDFALLTEEDHSIKQTIYIYAKKILHINISILLFFILSFIFLNYLDWGYILLPVLVYFSVLYNINYNYNLSKKDQKNNFYGKLIQGGGGVFGQLTLYFVFKNMFGLVFGQIFGFILSILYMDKPKRLDKKKLNLKKYKSFLIQDSIGNFLKVVTNHIALLVITFLYGAVISGSYYMATRVLIIPVATISAAFSQYISSKFIRWKRKNIFEINLKSILELIIVFTIIGLIVINKYIYDVFLFILGGQWVESAKIAYVILVWLCLKFVFESVSSVFSLEDHRSQMAFFQLSLNIATVFSVIFGYYMRYKFGDVVELMTKLVSLIYFLGILYFIKCFLNEFKLYLFSIIVLFSLIYFLLKDVNNIFLDFSLIALLPIYVFIRLKQIKGVFYGN